MRNPSNDPAPRQFCGIVPPYLLEHIANATPERTTLRPDAADCCRNTLAIDRGLRTARSYAGRQPTPIADGQGRWAIYSAKNLTSLPGTLVRSEGDPAPGDPAPGDPAGGDVAVDEAAAGIAATLNMYSELFDRDSFDGQGAQVVGTVHYGNNYANAFWDGQQLVFGDGDGQVFDRLTKAVDVLAHELTHAVIQYTGNLTYQGQSGALNESLADVFGVCLKQRVLGQSAAEADWLIGAGVFLPGVQGRALRSMLEPGTAYDDPTLGKDPQPATMADYVETSDDNGGVHLNSGIPNRAFALAALAIGGTAIEGAGRIWWSALNSVRADVDFAGFAAATVAAAGPHADAVRSAWGTVGVAADGVPAEPTGPSGPAPTLVRVRRTGGFAGLSVSGEIDLGSADPMAEQVRALLGRVDLSALPGTGQPHPDGFVYHFSHGGVEKQLTERELPGELRELATLLLQRGS